VFAKDDSDGFRDKLLDEALEDLRQNPDAGIRVDEALAQARVRIAVLS
jgi:hypothetical protein